MASQWTFSVWRYLGPLAAPLLLLTLVLTLWEPVSSWLEGHEKYDREVLQEWIREAQNEHHSLGSLLDGYFRELDNYHQVRAEVMAELKKEKVAVAKPGPVQKPLGEAGMLKGASPADSSPSRLKGKPSENLSVAAVKLCLAEPEEENTYRNQAKGLMRFSLELGSARTRVEKKQEQIQKLLDWLAVPFVRADRVRYPLFPLIYQIIISHDLEHEEVIASWDSGLPRQKKEQYQEFSHTLDIDENYTAHFYIQYHFRVYASRQDHTRQNALRQVWFTSAAALACTLLLMWVYFAWNRARQQQWQHMVAEQQVNEAKRKQLEEELRRQDAERRHQEAEHAHLELKSQLWANISILAGSYAHNIKNLLVRPNDLLSRCLEADGLSGNQGHMLNEVRQTLGTVTERLQQILQTVRRDPTQVKRVRVNLNELLEEMRDTWQELAREKWQLTISLDLAPEPVWIEGDKSNLQQAIENLLFNARDATFEMRNHLREQARGAGARSDPMNRDTTNSGDRAGQQRRQALIAAAGWQGEVILRTRREAGHAVLEVQDNGIGMTEEVRRRCTETHFSTKRHSALFAGFSAGMGLGLSFIQVILDHHQAEMSVESEPLKGTTFRIRFPE